MKRTTLGVGLTVGTGVLAVAMAGPALAETGSGQLMVTPTAATPGQSVTVMGTCPNNGGGFQGVTSTAFSGGMATISNASASSFSGSAMIMPNAAGKYMVTALCGPTTITIQITVTITHGMMMTPTKMPTMTPTMAHTMMPTTTTTKMMTPTKAPTGMMTTPMGTAQVSMTPMGAPNTGSASGGSSGGMVAIAAGGALLAGGAGVLVMRGRGRRTRTARD